MLARPPVPPDRLRKWFSALVGKIWVWLTVGVFLEVFELLRGEFGERFTHCGGGGEDKEGGG